MTVYSQLIQHEEENKYENHAKVCAKHVFPMLEMSMLS